MQVASVREILMRWHGGQTLLLETPHRRISNNKQVPTQLLAHTNKVNENRKKTRGSILLGLCGKKV